MKEVESYEQAIIHALADQALRVYRWEGKKRPLTISEQRSAVLFASVTWVIRRIGHAFANGWRDMGRGMPVFDRARVHY